MNKKKVIIALIIITFIQIGGFINIENYKIDFFWGIFSYKYVYSQNIYLYTVLIFLLIYITIYIFTLFNSNKEHIKQLKPINTKYIKKKYLYFFYIFTLISIFNTYYNGNNIHSQNLLIEVIVSNVGYYHIIPIIAGLSLNKYLNNVHDYIKITEYSLSQDNFSNVKNSFYNYDLKHIFESLDLRLISNKEANMLITNIVTKKLKKNFNLGETYE
jgi:magnesium-transporting ATPase (P-type)